MPGPAPVANDFEVPNSMSSLANVMNVATQMQALKKSRATFDADVAQRQAESAKAGTEASVASQTAGPRVEQQAAVTAGAKTEAESKKFQLQGQQAQKTFDSITALLKHPAVANGDVGGTIDALAEAKDRAIASGVPRTQAEGIFAPFITKAAHGKPGEFEQTLKTVLAQGLPAQQQVAAATPSGYQATNQAQTGLMNTNPLAGNVGITPGTVVQQQLPLGERQTVGTNSITGAPQTTAKDAFGNVIGVTQTPTGPGVPVLRPGEKEEIPERTKQRVAVNQAAAKVPEQHFNNQQIIKLAPESFAGTGGQTLAKLASSNGVQWVPGDHAGNLQRLGHFMSLQAQANAQAMGAGTDAARSISEQATGSTGWTPAAIVSTAKVNDALATGVDLFNRGMEKAIAKNGGNVLAVRDFQNAWSQNFDPTAMQLHNAIQSGDRKEIDAIVQSVGGKGSAGAHMLAAKLKNMETLVDKGGLQ